MLGQAVDSLNEATTNCKLSIKDVALVRDVPIFDQIYKSQQQHGLRHGDYARYRRFCTKKISNLRRLCGLQFTSRQKKFVAPKMQSKDYADERVLRIQLYSAERCWAKAMDLKYCPKDNSESVDEVSSYAVTRKLRKAAYFATELSKMAQNGNFTVKSALESVAYCQWIKGLHGFEQSLWNAAFASLAVAKYIMGVLESYAHNDTEKALYSTKMADFAAHLRYCTAQLELNPTTESIDHMVESQLVHTEYIKDSLSNAFAGMPVSVINVNWPLSPSFTLSHTSAIEAHLIANSAESQLASHLSEGSCKSNLSSLDLAIANLAGVAQKLQACLRYDQNFQAFEEKREPILDVGVQLNPSMQSYLYTLYLRTRLRVVRRLLDYKRLFESGNPLDSRKRARQLMECSDLLERISGFTRPAKSMPTNPFLEVFANACSIIRNLILSRTLDCFTHKMEKACLLSDCDTRITKLQEQGSDLKLLQEVFRQCQWKAILATASNTLSLEATGFATAIVSAECSKDFSSEIESFSRVDLPIAKLMPVVIDCPITVNLTDSLIEFPVEREKEKESDASTAEPASLLSNLVKRFWS